MRYPEFLSSPVLAADPLIEGPSPRPRWLDGLPFARGVSRNTDLKPAAERPSMKKFPEAQPLALSDHKKHKLRIAMLAAGDVFGGAERQLLTLCRAGSPYFDAIIFQCQPGPLAEEAARVGLTVRTDIQRSTVSANGRALAKVLKAHQLDLVHAHGYLGSVLAALARASGAILPFVRTVHGATERSFFSKMALYGHLGDLATRFCRGESVYVSHELCNRVKAHGPHDHVIHNGVEFAEEAPMRPTEYASSVFNFLIVGRLEPVKDVSNALEAFAASTFAQPAQLHIVGEGPERAALEAKVRAYGLDSRVHFHGFRADVLSFIAHADALLIPSRHEGIPYVLLEALWLGTPVIASNVGGIPEVVSNHWEALLVPPRTPGALSAAMSTLMLNHVLRSHLSARGKVRVTQGFTAKTMARRYYELYRNCLAR